MGRINGNIRIAPWEYYNQVEELSVGHNPPYVHLWGLQCTDSVNCSHGQLLYGARASRARRLRIPCLHMYSVLPNSPKMTRQNTCAPYQVLLTYNARETHLISTVHVYKDDLTDDCQPVSKMRSKKAQKKASAAATTRQGPKKRPGEDDRRREEESDGS
ncbi:hypothetical protein Bbelb_429110 [Branchiostoma belcheri]|nr:hypothetical protein Bbelb_429110 [Branchiostoma belcheri]